MGDETHTDTKKILILVTIFLVLFLSFFFVFWRPGYSSLRQHQTDLSNKEAELIQLERDAKDWPDSITRGKLGQYENELDRLWELIPTKERVAMLLDEIESLAKASNLEIYSLARIQEQGNRSLRNPAEADPQAKKEPEYVRIPYKISLGGDYSGLLRFLRRLEDSRRLVTVVGIRMAVGQGTRSVDSEIQFNIFYSRVEVGRS